MSKKKIGMDESALVLVSIFVSVVSVIIASFIVSALNTQRADRGYYGKNAMSVVLDSTQKGVISPVLAFAEKQKNILITSEEPSLKRIFFIGKVETPPVVEGRFFTPQDFLTGKRYAVFGRTPTLTGLSMVYHDGKTYIQTYEGDQYEVIGTVGYSVPSKIDKMVFINLDGRNPADQYSKELTLSSFGAPVSTLYPTLKAALDQAGFYNEPATIADTQTGFSQFVHVDKLNTIMILFAFFSLVLSTLPVSVRWIVRRRKMIAVERLLGFSPQLIVAHVVFRYFLLFNLAFTVGYFGIWVATLLNIISTYSVLSLSTLIAYLIALAFNLCIAIPAVFLSMRIQPGDALRRDV